MTPVPHSRTADEPTIRFKPTRAGVIGLWDYADEEFVFADGRLVLRGHNGSGKTKALELLFPLVLDGVLDARRLNPFSGQERTMKSNLLYKGQESAYGYVWMEFARTGHDGSILEAVTVGIGMRVSRAMPAPARFFFVTDGRVGIDFGLLDASSRPLREKALKSLLGERALCGTAEAYREKVDDRLFGLGPERYSQLVSLLLHLRQPLLATDLDPVKLSDTLTAGLRPVDDGLVLQAARDFENLAEIQEHLDALTGADRAVRDFLRDYTAYLRAHARDRVDHVTERVRETAAQCEKIMQAAEDRRASERRLASARQERDAAERQCNEIGARLAEYRNHNAIKEHDSLAELRDRVHAERRGIAESERHHHHAQTNLAALRGEAEHAVRRHDELREAASRHARDLQDAARRCGILQHDGTTLDLGAEPDTDVTGHVAARRNELEDVRACLGAYEDAAAHQEREQMGCDAAGGELAEAERQSVAAAGSLAAARAAARQELDDFVSRWSMGDGITVLTAADGEALRAAIDTVGEPEAAPLTEVFRSRIDQRRTRALALVEALKREHSDIADAVRSRRAEYDAVAAEADDAPPPSDLRPASRVDRPGAPLWQLVRFADHVPDDHAAAVEGALYAAGLLTAWLHPDPALTGRALHDKTADAYLRPLPLAHRPSGRTLADVLVVEDQQFVGGAAVRAVLASIAVADGVPAPGTAGPPAVTTGSHFCLGVQVGAHPKERPEYIGATARAARRRGRLALLSESIAALEAQLVGVEDQQRHAQGLCDDFDRARRELTRTQPITDAVGEMAVVAERVAGARRRLAGARRRLDGAIARAHERNRQLRQLATASRLPTVREELNDVARAIDDFADAGKALALCQEQADAAERDLDGRRQIIAAHTESCSEQAEALQARRDELAVREERLRAQEATLEAPLQAILRQIADSEEQLAAAQEAYGRATGVAEEQRDRVLRAGHALEFGRAALTTAVAEQVRTALALEPYARPDLLGLLDADAESVWVPRDRWPSPEQAVQVLVDGVGSPGARLTGLEAAWTVVPAPVASLVGALGEATQGRPVTASLLKAVTTGISAAISALETALLESDLGFLFEWEPDGDIILARVIDSEGPAPVADFARRLAEQLADQGVLLEDRERTVLEDGLLTGLAEQIHDRTVVARDLVRSMDVLTRSKPMSSGATVGISWVVSDALTDSQQAVNRLLDKDASGLGPAGLAELRSHLRSQIRARKAAADRTRSYHHVIAEVLDYRAWRKFELRLFRPGMSEEDRRKGELLTRAKHSVMSGGEKSASLHLPLFAAAHAKYTSAYPTCPRLVALDEAFAGIDEKYRPDLLALTTRFDLDLFMTGHDLWITYRDVPQISHYDLKHDEASHTVSAMLLVWDGEQLLDNLGYSGADDLAAGLLGFVPSRHVPTQAEPLTEPDEDGQGGGAGV